MNTSPKLYASSHWPDNPRLAIEDDLRAIRGGYIESDFWPSAVRVINRLLARSAELGDAYDELVATLRSPVAIAVLLDAVVMTAAFWNPEKIDEARAARDDLDETNTRIATVARELAGLLRHRSEIHNHSAFSSDTVYHVIDVVDTAARSDGRYRTYVQERLMALRSQFDFKYWPSLSKVIDVIAADAETAQAEAGDSLTRAATTGAKKASKASFFKALFEALREGRHQIPAGYRPSDAAMASLGSCALDLGPDEIVDSTYVKSLRQRMRAAPEKSADMGSNFRGGPGCSDSFPGLLSGTLRD